MLPLQWCRISNSCASIPIAAHSDARRCVLPHSPRGTPYRQPARVDARQRHARQLCLPHHTAVTSPIHRTLLHRPVPPVLAALSVISSSRVWAAGCVLAAAAAVGPVRPSGGRSRLLRLLVSGTACIPTTSNETRSAVQLDSLAPAPASRHHSTETLVPRSAIVWKRSSTTFARVGSLNHRHGQQPAARSSSPAALTP